jgi:DNA topoisomerase-3
MVQKVLSVAEKPSVAKELARIISKGTSTTRNGFSQYNRLFDISRCDFQGRNVSMTMTSVTGHMMETDFTSNHRTWGSCNPLELFRAPVETRIKKESEKIAETLQSEAKKANILLLWLDCDLEGENIGDEVSNVCLEANPRLDIYRARFSALIDRDIFRTLRIPDRPNQHMIDAVNARSEIDLRLGIILLILINICICIYKYLY